MNDETKGIVQISGKEDREALATILFRNGYTVSTKRRKKNGKTYVYYVAYELNEYDMEDGDFGG